jgi:hypothetical protein
MDAFAERVVAEKQELDTKISALYNFITGNAFYKTLPSGEQTRLRAQLATMRPYSAILGDRIEKEFK